MRSRHWIAAVLFGALSLAPAAFGQSGQGEFQQQGSVIVTVLPKKDGTQPTISAQGAKLKVNGKDATITQFSALTGPGDPLELVILIDNSSRTSLGRQLDDLGRFVRSLPANTQVAIAYMQNGQARLSGPLTADHAAAAQGLHLPSGSAGSNGSPYFCISDLAKHWPSREPNVRREVLAITNGVDEYSRRFDPDDPYLQAAIADAVRARIVIYSIYWGGQGFADSNQSADNAGQNLLGLVTQATGGKSFWIGLGNPVSFEPYLDELSRRLRNQYELSFNAPFSGKAQVDNMRLKFVVPGSSVDAPEQVFVYRPGTTQD